MAGSRLWWCCGLIRLLLGRQCLDPLSPPDSARESDLLQRYSLLVLHCEKCLLVGVPMLRSDHLNGYSLPDLWSSADLKWQDSQVGNDAKVAKSLSWCSDSAEQMPLCGYECDLGKLAGCVSKVL